MFKNNKLAKNLIASFLTYGISFAVSFFLTPFITKTMGVEANGFVTLANQIVGYISLITVALTSMASRFISISFFKKEYERANVYYNSVIGATTILAVIITIPSVIFITQIDSFINVGTELLVDVKILFSLVFFNFLLGLILQVFSIATYITNQLYLNSLRSIEGNLIRVALIVLSYAFFEAKMYYVSLGGFVSALYSYLWNIYYTRELLPQMRIDRKYFQIKAVWELVSAGSWNIVIQLNSILNTGLDLLLSNLILGEVSMGILSVAKTIPVSITTMLNSVSGIFFPEMTQLYAENRLDELTLSINRSIKILALIFNIPVVFLMTFGDCFYLRWQPSLDSGELQILSLLTICTLLVSGSTAAVFGIFTITNKLKFHSLTSLAFGVMNLVIVVMLLKAVPIEYGLYVVAGISSVLIIIRNYTITFPYAAKCVGQKWYAFHIPSLKTVFGALIAAALCYVIRFVYVPLSWIGLLLCGVLSTIICTVVNAFIIFNKDDRKYLIQIVKNKITNMGVLS